MCGTIREDFDPNNAAMSLWLVFIKYIYAWKIMAIWSHYWLAWILGYIIVWWYTTTLFKSLISKFIQSWNPCYGVIHFKTYAKTFVVQLVHTSYCLHDSKPPSFVITIELSKRLQNMWFYLKTLILITLNKSLVSV